MAGRCHSLEDDKEDGYDNGQDEGDHEHTHEQRRRRAHLEDARRRVKVAQRRDLKEAAVSQ